MTKHPWWPCALAALTVASAAIGCQNAQTEAETGIVTPLPSAQPVIAGDVLAARGQIVQQTSLTEAFDDPDEVIGQAWRAVYRSVSGLDGRAHDVSGAFFVPSGSPPPGGWPVVSMAHGTTGIAEDCGPSWDRALLGFLPAVTSYLAKGYAIAMSDYEGLGTPGPHPYLEPRTAAFNIADAVRALRNLFPDISARWQAFGNSQGGQAAWSVNEVAGWYGGGLDLVGTVALSPAANITALADLAYRDGLTKEQQAVMPIVVAGISRFDRGLSEHSLLPRLTIDQENEVFSCKADTNELHTNVIPNSGIHLDDQTTAALREALRKVALPQAPLTVPMLVINGLADQTIPPQWVSAAVDQTCEMGGQIAHFEVERAGHGDLGATAYDVASAWVDDRFASRPAPSNCGAPPAVLP